MLDEHIPPLYRTQLVRREPELIVRIIGDPDAPPKGTLDPEILVWCEVHSFLLVTNNRQSMLKHLADYLAQDRHIPGILVMDSGRTVGEAIEELIIIAGASYDDEY